MLWWISGAIDDVRRYDGVLDGLVDLRLEVSHAHDIRMQSRNSVHEFLRGTSSGQIRLVYLFYEPCAQREHRPGPSLPPPLACAASVRY